MKSGIKIALIGLVGALGAAIISGIFMLFHNGDSGNISITGNQSQVVTGNYNVVQMHHSEEISDESANKIAARVTAYMHQIEKTDSDELIKRYPKGYCLFAVTQTQLIVPSKSRLLQDYDINWGAVKIERTTPKEIIMVLPYIHSKITGSSITGFATSVPRQSPKKVFPFPFQGAFQDKIFIELLADNQDGIIFAIGFK